MNERTSETERTVAALSRDIVFQVLSNRRRRYALHHLRRCEGSVEIGELATQIAAWENDVSTEEVTSKQRKRVYNTLQQAHLPKLDETGFVEYDPAHGNVTLTGRARMLDVYLELVPDNDFPWSEYYFALGCISLVLAAGAWLNAGPLGLVPTSLWAVGLGSLVTLSGAAHIYHQRNVYRGYTEVSEEV
ncbi:DUF7344 domain-containing protein [Haladaptatus salinisoli]|uniref:DUF7344 domain-containing protein n=1 Tax=Haladaptatus salinisoli TaxID=2884876 RepID=UPI001D09DD82|nr:hypothetical protein [Haladaptatus salinisoli]